MILYKTFLIIATFSIFLISFGALVPDSYAQSKYSPFFVNETAVTEKNKIEYETYSSPEYGFSIDYLKGATIDDKLDVEKASQMYMGVEGPEVQFQTNDLGPMQVQFSSFSIYLNDSINMDRYIYRDLYGSFSGRGTDYETEVLDSGSPITVAGLPGKSIKFKPGFLGIIKEAAYFNDGVNTYHIEYTDQESSYRQEIFDHIVNSFKFIPIVTYAEDDEDVSEGTEQNEHESDVSDGNNNDENEDDNHDADENDFDND